ncbi:UNVERIFIED_CONTAM: hypothetical protein HDU68_006982 [Siphonaria sp. JEL0065]|nr:hypothetical protein HDU68_006982 [Siphonaria sp. JEL0065]
MRHNPAPPGMVTLCFDGGASPNPGKAAWGAICYYGAPVAPQDQPDQQELFRTAGNLGSSITNNYSEYMGLIGGLRQLIIELRGISVRDVAVFVRGDSLLVVNQMKGIWNVESESLQVLHAIASSLVDLFRSVRFEHIPRVDNVVADSLANTIINNPTLTGFTAYYPNLIIASTVTIGRVTVNASNDLGAAFAAKHHLIDAKFLRYSQSSLAKFWGLRDAGSDLQIVSGNGFTAPILGSLPSLAIDLHPFVGPRNPTQPKPFMLKNVLVVDGLPVPFHLSFNVDSLLEFAGTVRMGGNENVKFRAASFPQNYQTHEYWAGKDDQFFLPL